jgi:S-adenosylmethionine:tRNA ribosyltransferase-isomerase
VFSLTDYDYDLPPELVAQSPCAQRDRSRLMCLNRAHEEIAQHLFCDVADFLQPGDVLVVNDTRVIPGRLLGKKATGGRVEVLLADFAGGSKAVAGSDEFNCECLIKAAKAPKTGTLLVFEQGLTGKVLEQRNGTYIVRFSAPEDFDTVLDRIGRVPLPPYIRRPDADGDRQSYQTVYASQKGAVAAPTAGLHFTEDLLGALRSKGIQIVGVTLHVGYGTFQPVRSHDIRQHRMHAERFVIPETSTAVINAARSEGRPVVAVGTTCVRTLEYASDDHGVVRPGSGFCDLFIYPGYRFKAVDAMITNFHLPKSTLLMLVSAFAGREMILKAYREAIQCGYRFYSYGDAMFIR